MANENKGNKGESNTEKKGVMQRTKDWFRKEDGTLHKGKVAGVAVAGTAVVVGGGYAGYKILKKKDASSNAPVVAA